MIPYAEDFKKNQETESSYNEQETHIEWYHYVLLNRPSKVVTALLLVAVLSPLLLYTFILSSSLDLAPADGYSQGSCILPRESRLPCGKGYIEQSQCHPQCCYDLVNSFCFHRLPSRFSYIMDREWNEDLILQPRVATEPFASQPSLSIVRLSLDEVSPRHLGITFYNPLEVNVEARKLVDKDYDYTVSSPELNLEVKTDGISIFNTRRGPLIASEDIWETSFQLTNESMYGFGEIPLGNSSKIIYSSKDTLTSLPLIYAKVNGSFHGLLIDIETPTEIFLAGDNQIVVRSITKKQLKFHLFLGPSPREVMENVMEFLGFENTLEYWMLGAHICSETGDTVQRSLENLIEFMNEAKSINLPFESHCGTAPILLNQGCDDEEYSQSMENGANLVQTEGKMYIPHLYPYVRVYNTTETPTCSIDDFTHVLLQYDNASYTGQVADTEVVYPNYLLDGSKDLLIRLWRLNENSKAILLENSWPLDESGPNNETFTFLPYFNEELETAFRETPRWNSTMDGNLYLYSHNKYGENFYKTVKNIVGDKPVFTSSHWMNAPAYINRQTVDTTWSNLRKQLTEAALGGISGNWYWSSPICGDTDTFNPDTSASLCAKWYMAATYVPLVKIHSKSVPRDPTAFNGTTKQHMLTALNTRTSLLPYFYTVLQSGPLLRPMFYQYPQSNVTEISTQFNVGDDLLIVPNFLPGQSLVNVWLPPGTWYEMWSGLKIGQQGEVVALATTEADFVTLIRGGSVVFVQKDVKPSAEETRRTSNYTLIIALDCTNAALNTNGSCAYGQLYINRNMTINISSSDETLILTYVGDDIDSLCGADATSANLIKEIIVYGLDTEKNNYDHHRHVDVSLDLCEFETSNEITYSI